MKKRWLSLVFLFLAAYCLYGQQAAESAIQVEMSFDTDPETGYLQRRVFDMPLERDSVFFVISKVEPIRISVYERRRRDTVLLAAYPCCLSVNKGAKIFDGDCRTPESWPRKPFKIWRINDLRRINQVSSEFRKFGPYYHALAVPGVVGVAIHGTNAPSSIAKGRVSHGCIRLLNEDCEHLHDNYAQVGIQVIILPENKGPLPFEERALRVACGLYPEGCSIGCGPNCYHANRPCSQIHINPQMDWSRVRYGL